MSVDIQPPLPQVWAKARLMRKGREEADNSQQTQWFYFFRVLGTVTATEDGDIAAFQTSFPSYEEKFFETARSRQGRADRRRRSDTLDGLGPFRDDSQAGKGGKRKADSEPEALLSGGGDMCRQPWFYLRLVAYSFIRLSEGA